METEIGRKYDYYYEPKVTMNCKSIKSFEWDAVELLHYIEYIHENSYAMIHEQTNLIANNIKSQMDDDSTFPNEVIKTVDLPKDFKNLSDHLRFGPEEGPELCKTLKNYFKLTRQSST